MYINVFVFRWWTFTSNYIRPHRCKYQGIRTMFPVNCLSGGNIQQWKLFSLEFVFEFIEKKNRKSHRSRVFANIVRLNFIAATGPRPFNSLFPTLFELSFWSYRNFNDKRWRNTIQRIDNVRTIIRVWTSLTFRSTKMIIWYCSILYCILQFCIGTLYLHFCWAAI